MDRGELKRGRNRTESNDGQALTTFEAAGANDFATTFGGHAGAIADLAGALQTMGAEGGFHDFLAIKGD